MLKITKNLVDEMLAHCLQSLPNEGCGLIVGSAHDETVQALYLSENLANSAVVYTVDPKVHLRADRQAESSGQAILGVFHSHTHTEAYPSATDIAQAPDPSWHYVIVSLRESSPSVRSFRIVDQVAREEALELAD